eukprot:m.19871 g.19871  ORF g.19871 m.19871 type:complete len:53 (-) comp8090_c0_seq2:634-792(-)
MHNMAHLCSMLHYRGKSLHAQATRHLVPEALPPHQKSSCARLHGSTAITWVI